MHAVLQSVDAQASVLTVASALHGGAAGFVPKTKPREVLTSALVLVLVLVLVLASGVYMPREALGAAPPVEPSTAPTPNATATSSPQSLGLTERQINVLALVMKNRTNKRICRELKLAEPTVRYHVTAILRALKVSSRTEAVLAVMQRGWRLEPR